MSRICDRLLLIPRAGISCVTGSGGSRHTSDAPTRTISRNRPAARRVPRQAVRTAGARIGSSTRILPRPFFGAVLCPADAVGFHSQLARLPFAKVCLGFTRVLREPVLCFATHVRPNSELYSSRPPDLQLAQILSRVNESEWSFAAHNARVKLRATP